MFSPIKSRRLSLLDRPKSRLKFADAKCLSVFPHCGIHREALRSSRTRKYVGQNYLSIYNFQWTGPKEYFECGLQPVSHRIGLGATQYYWASKWRPVNSHCLANTNHLVNILGSVCAHLEHLVEQERDFWFWYNDSSWTTSLPGYLAEMRILSAILY